MNLFTKARELGQALTETQEYLNMRAAESAVLDDDEASGLIDEWNRLREGFVEAMTQRGNAPEEAAERMRALKETMQLNPRISAMETSRACFSHLLDQVNDVLHYTVTGEKRGEDEPQHAHGGCANCEGGCYLH